MSIIELVRPSDRKATPEAAVTSGVPSPDWKALMVLLIGTFLIVMDFFVVNVALPSIQRDLGASPATLEWVVAGYGLTFSVLLITGGRLGDRFGRRNTFAIGVLVFVVASVACGLAPSSAFLVVSRLLQGVGAALISPNVLSIIGVLYLGSNRVKAITAYGLVMGLAAAAGQVVGGLLIAANVDGAGWRTIFLINVPIGVAALFLARRMIPETRAARPGRLDLGGIGLATLGLGAIVLPLVEGRQTGWPTWTWVCLASAPLILVALVRRELSLARAGREPLLHPAIFQNARLRAGLLIQLMCWCTQASFFLVLALYLQEGRGLSPLASGLMFVSLAGSFVLASRKAPMLTARYGRNLVLAGVAVVALGDLGLWATVSLVSGSLDVLWLLPGLVLVGVGQALWITPLTTTILAHAEPERAGLVSGALSTMQQLGNALGVAVIGIVYFAALNHGHATAFAHSLVALTLALGVAAGLTRLLPSSKTQAQSPAVASSTTN